MKPIVNQDPGDEQTALFTDPPKCTARGCDAGDRKNLCTHDADIADGIRDPYARRPTGCLNSFDFMVPDDQPLPF